MKHTVRFKINFHSILKGLIMYRCYLVTSSEYGNLKFFFHDQGQKFPGLSVFFSSSSSSRNSNRGDWGTYPSAAKKKHISKVEKIILETFISLWLSVEFLFGVHSFHWSFIAIKMTKTLIAISYFHSVLSCEFVEKNMKKQRPC